MGLKGISCQSLNIFKYCTDSTMIGPTAMREQKESLQWVNSIIEVICATFTIMILVGMITRLFLHNSSSFGTERDIAAEISPSLPQKNVPRRKSKRSRKNRRP